MDESGRSLVIDTFAAVVRQTCSYAYRAPFLSFLKKLVRHRRQGGKHLKTARLGARARAEKDGHVGRVHPHPLEPACGNGFFHRASVDDLRTDNLLHPLFHPAQYERNPCGGNNTQPKSTLDGQIARNISMDEWGFLATGESLIHDRDGKYCPSFLKTLEGGRVRSIALPPRSPNLNAYAERWVRSRQGRVPVKRNSLRREISSTCFSRVRRALPSRA